MPNGDRPQQRRDRRRAGLFKSFTAQAGLDYDVALETRGGAGFEFHLENKLGVIGRRPWDKVVMQGQSMLDLDKPGDATKRSPRAVNLRTSCAAAIRNVDLYLMATWSRADQTYPNKGAWFGQPIEAMARDVRAGIDKAAAAASVKTVIPVGEAWTRAMEAGVADRNPYDGIEPGRSISGLTTATMPAPPATTSRLWSCLAA